MPVTQIKDDKHLKNTLTSAGDKVCIVDFTAQWCGPCKMIAPVFEQLSNEYRQCVFLKVDVDECSDIAEDYNVTAMPTFVFIKKEEEVDRIRGADKTELERKLKQYAGEPQTAFVGEGHRLGAGGMEAQVKEDKVKMDLGGREVDKAQAQMGVDDRKPVTKVNVRLSDGTRFTVSLNLSQPVSKIRDFICTLHPEQSGKSFSLMTTFPKKEVEDETMSLQDAGLANAVVIQKMK